MKTVVGSVIAAAGASACCLGPVVLSALGAGALGAAAVKLEPLRPLLMAVAAVLLGVGFVRTYRRRPSEQCATEDSCAASSKRTASIVLWLATVAVILLITFPYYVNWLI